jgi:hypothetical protein
MGIASDVPGLQPSQAVDLKGMRMLRAASSHQVDADLDATCTNEVQARSRLCCGDFFVARAKRRNDEQTRSAPLLPSQSTT